MNLSYVPMLIGTFVALGGFFMAPFTPLTAVGGVIILGVMYVTLKGLFNE